MNDWHTGKMTSRRLYVVITGLPLTSALHRAIPGDEGWTVTDYLVAQAIDLMQGLAWQNGNRGVEASRRSKYPDRFPTPAVRVQREREQAQLMARLDAMDDIPI